MIQSLRVCNFKTLKSFDIDNMQNINIFVGEPDTGKTTILEALSVFLGRNPQILLTASFEARNIIGHDDCLDGLFHDHKTSHAITMRDSCKELRITLRDHSDFSILIDSSGDRKEDILFKRQLNFNIKNLSSNHQQADIQDNDSMMIFEKKERQVNYKVTSQCANDENLKQIRYIASHKNFESLRVDLEAILKSREQNRLFHKELQEAFPEVENIHFVRNNQIFVSMKGLTEDVQLQMCGSGFQSYLAMLIACWGDHKYIFIDEIENGLHYSTVKIIFNFIVEKCNEKQFFITTHNKEILECLQKLLLSKKEQMALYAVFRNQDGYTQCARHSQHAFLHHIHYDNEMRG